MHAFLLQTVPQYVPFKHPMPVWNYWYLLLIPLCALISIAYKAIKCRTMKEVPREAAVIFLMIVAGMALAAGILMGFMRLMEKA